MPPSAQDLLPSDADVEFYEEHGWWISPRLFSPAQMDDAVEAAAGQIPAPSSGAKHRLHLQNHIVHQEPRIATIGLAPVLGAVAARLARTDEVRLFYSALISKPPSTSPGDATIGWHVERAYWQQSSSLQMLSAWIPLHDCDEEMGTITMIDRSHRWPASPALDAMRTDIRWADDLADVERDIAALGHPIEKVPMRMERGQVSFHHCLTFHGSAANRSRRPRVAVTVHLQDRDNRYREVRGADGERVPCVQHNLVRRLDNGDPDYSDPEVCPVIWREGAEAHGVTA